jgi:hypothetical protein
MLSKLFASYSMGIISRKELEGHIFQFILDNHHEFRPYRWNQEDYTDFACAFYPQLSRAIDTYRETGSTFDSYIVSLVHWGVRETRSRRQEHHIAEYACWEAKARDEAAVQEEEAMYNEPEPVFDRVINPRQVLVLLLKSYHYMSPDFLERISPALDMDTEKLKDMLEGVRDLRLKRDEDIRALQERIYTQFYRCMVFEKKLSNLIPGTGLHEKMRGRLIRGRRRLQSMRDRLAKMKMAASNKQVAQVLNSSKGTVDSHMFRFKAKPGSCLGKNGHKNRNDPRG